MQILHTCGPKYVSIIHYTLFLFVMGDHFYFLFFAEFSILTTGFALFISNSLFFIFIHFIYYFFEGFIIILLIINYFYFLYILSLYLFLRDLFLIFRFIFVELNDFASI
jgi:hypothetical protein